MQTILVTGSAGHLGQHISDALLSCRLRLRGLDLRGRGSDRGDIRDEVSILRAIAGVAGIIHLAAVSRVADAEADPATCATINVEGTRLLLDAAQLSATPPWVLFVSSREVLGSIPSGCVADENTLPLPRNAYGRSKLDAERLVMDATTRGLKTCVVRLSNVFGSPWDRPERVIPSFLRRALVGAPLHVRGPERAFDFLHVDDALRGLLGVVSRLQAGVNVPSIVQFCAGRATTLGDLAEHILTVTRSSSPLVLEHASLHEVECFRGSHALATRTLGWMPTVSLEDGLHRLAPQLHTQEAVP